MVIWLHNVLYSILWPRTRIAAERLLTIYARQNSDDACLQ